MSSQIKTVMLLALLSALLMFMGAALGGRTGLMFGLILALVMNVGSYWFSDKIVLSMYRGRELAPYDAPGLHAMVDELARAADIPKPRVFIVPQEAPNAFATGRDPEHGVVAVTEGMVRLLSPDEIRGVLAHEISHIRNRDILVQTVAGVLASVVMYAANIMQWTAIFGGGGNNDDRPNPFVALAMALIAPVAAMLIQMAISRSREYLADETGARLARDPLQLAAALEKLEAWNQQVPMTQGSQATAHMFIVNPFSGAGAAALFSTHPPIAERIARLRAMAHAR